MKKNITLAALAAVAIPLTAQAKTFIVNTPLDVTDVAPGNGSCNNGANLCSLRGAVQEANLYPGPDIIQLSPGTYFLTRQGRGEDAASTGDLDVTQTVTIEGAGAVFDLASYDRGFDVRSASAVLTLRDLLIRNGVPYAEGGALRVYGSAVLERVDLNSNSGNGGGAVDVKSGGSLTFSGESDHGMLYNQDTDAGCLGGGAILNEGGTVTLDSFHLEQNMSLCNGGAVKTGPGTVTATQGIYAGNSGGNGGVFSIGAGTLTINNGEFYDNQADFDGGVIMAFGGTVTVTGAFIEGNHTGLKGGIIAASGGTVNVNFCGLTGSSATDGGAISVTAPGTVAVADSTIDNNIATTRGGGVHAAGTITIVRSDLEYESAGVRGGSIAVVSGGGAYVMDNSVVHRNSAAGGGAMSAEGGGHISILHSTVIDNWSTGSDGGGAVLVLGASDLTVASSGLISNDAQAGPGGAIAALNQGSVAIYDSTLSGNHASGNGGGVLVTNTAHVNLQGTTVAQNISDTKGGGVSAGVNASARIWNTILAGNTAPSFPGTRSCNGTVTSVANSLIEWVGGCVLVQSGGDVLNVSAGLQTLTTINSQMVHPILSTSPAHDAGNASFCSSNDQVGTYRFFPNGKCDIGAYEIP